MPDVITISLPDGSERELPEGATAGDLAADIGKRLAKAASRSNDCLNSL